MTRLTHEDFLSLTPDEIDTAREEVFFLLGYVDTLEDGQRALRAFMTHIKHSAAGRARSEERTPIASEPRGPREASPPAEGLLTEKQIRAALCDLAANGVVYLDTEAHAIQVFNAAVAHRSANEMLTRGGTTVTLSRVT